jgi:CrcB protein|tara:strand:- start:84 stop:323 length:240 start_codon:yes stop_codon:yes gene_type:complete
MGVLIELGATPWSPGQELRALSSVGVLGALTTLLTSSLDAVALFERGAHIAAAAYVAGSAVLTIAAPIGGLHLIRAPVP